MDADLAKAIGQVLGLKINMVNATFDTIIPGLASGKYDLGMSSFTDTLERQKTVDFVTYFIAGTSFYVKASGPGIASLAGLCGHKVAVEKGTTQAADAQAQAPKCQSAGNPLTVEIFNDQNAVNLALSSGRADVAWPTRRWLPTRSSSLTACSSCRARSTAPRRTESRSPRTTGWPSPSWPPWSTSW
jgi:polar amino acid transport system substrate-binding protein